MPVHAPARRTRRPARLLARFGLAAALASTSALAGACGGKGDATGPSGLGGTYTLATVEGQAVPVTGTIQGATVKINSGSLQVSGTSYTMKLALTVNDQSANLDDAGSVQINGAALAFTSSKYNDQFAGQAANNNRTITATYALGDDPNEAIALEFRR